MHYHTKDLVDGGSEHIHETEETLRQYLFACGIMVHDVKDARLANMVVTECSDNECLKDDDEGV